MKLSDQQRSYLKELLFLLRDLQVDVDLVPLYEIIKGIDLSAIRSKAGRKGGLHKKQSEAKAKQNEAPPKQTEAKVKYAEFVFMKQTEYLTLKEKYPAKVVDTCITKLNAYKQATGKTYASDYGAINSWVLDKVLEQMNISKDSFHAKPKPTTNNKEKTYSAVEF